MKGRPELKWQVNKKYDLRLAEFDGGNLRNAIPREAHAVITIPAEFNTNLTLNLFTYSKL